MLWKPGSTMSSSYVPSALFIQLKLNSRFFRTLSWKAYGFWPPSALTSSKDTVEYVERPIGIPFTAAALEVAFSPSG